MNTDPRYDLACQLIGLDISPTRIGRAILGEGTSSALYRAGARILDATHTTDLDRLGALARGLGLVIEIGPAGVTVRAVDPTRSGAL